MNKGYIRVGHLVYIIIIAIIVLSFFLVIAFGGTDHASTKMGTASTVSSLILSVIAIVMSLIDVAGQRQSIVDLKETAEKLQESNESATILVEDLKLKMDDLQELKTQMVDSLRVSTEWKDELLRQVMSLKEKMEKGDPVDSKDFNPIIEKANKIISMDFSLEKYIEVQKRVDNLMRDYRKYLTPSAQVDIMPKEEEVMSAIRKEYDSIGKLPYDVIFNLIKKELNVPHQFVKEVIESLKKKKYIEIQKQSNGSVWVILKDKET